MLCEADGKSEDAERWIKKQRAVRRKRRERLDTCIDHDAGDVKVMGHLVCFPRPRSRETMPGESGFENTSISSVILEHRTNRSA
jgi:hypothetical protein